MEIHFKVNRVISEEYELDFFFFFYIEVTSFKWLQTFNLHFHIFEVYY